MHRRYLPHEPDHRHHAPGSVRTTADRTREPAPRVDSLEPTTRSALSLQQTAGNAAVALALRGSPIGAGVVQRQPKAPKKQPKFVTDAQSELGRQFPKLKVAIKDYGDLNPVLQGMDFKGWTQSATEIYVRDQSGLADPAVPKTKDWPAMVTAYIIHHEVTHVGQFQTAKGPPKKWQEMLKYELAAYSDDVVWLNGAQGKGLVSDPDLRSQLITGAEGTRDAIKKLLNKQTKLNGKDREDELYNDMVAAKLIPANSPKDPQLLYKQP
jgi:hypothetical protein